MEEKKDRKHYSERRLKILSDSAELVKELFDEVAGIMILNDDLVMIDPRFRVKVGGVEVSVIEGYEDEVRVLLSNNHVVEYRHLPLEDAFAIYQFLERL